MDRNLFFLLPPLIAAALTGCSFAGEPASAEEVESYMREEFAEDDEEVLWITVTDTGRPGSFDVVADVRDEGDAGDAGDAGDGITYLCSINKTSGGSSYTCSSAEPSIRSQLVDLVRSHYNQNGFDVLVADFERTGQGTDFAGEAILNHRQSNQRLRVVCEGTHEGLDMEFNCDRPPPGA